MFNNQKLSNYNLNGLFTWHCNRNFIVFLFWGMEGILLTLGKIILKLFHIKKFSSEEVSRKDQNVI